MTSHQTGGESSTPASPAGHALELGQPDRPQARVTAVIVAHNGSRWLPRLIAALESSSRVPDDLVAVDTSSTDDSANLLTASLGAGAVHTLESDLGFGAAVEQALTRGDASRDHHLDQPTDPGEAAEFVWLLHADCAPAPDALEQLVDVATADPAIAVVGGRIRAWPRGRRLLEVGLTMTGTGHRETGVEPGEYDQGQHDQQ